MFSDSRWRVCRIWKKLNSHGNLWNTCKCGFTSKNKFNKIGSWGTDKYPKTRWRGGTSYVLDLILSSQVPYNSSLGNDNLKVENLCFTYTSRSSVAVSSKNKLVLFFFENCGLPLLRQISSFSKEKNQNRARAEGMCTAICFMLCWISVWCSFQQFKNHSQLMILSSGCDF